MNEHFLHMYSGRLLCTSQQGVVCYVSELTQDHLRIEASKMFQTPAYVISRNGHVWRVQWHHNGKTPAAVVQVHGDMSRVLNDFHGRMIRLNDSYGQCLAYLIPSRKRVFRFNGDFDKAYRVG